APEIFHEDLDDAKVTYCDYVGRDGVTLMYHGRAVRFSQDAVGRCDLPDHSLLGGPRCEHWRPNGLNPLIEAAIISHDKSVALHKSAADAPLIVLAGLR